MSTIITRNSATSGSSPSSLVQGELAINVTDGKLFYGSGSGNVVKEFGVTSSYALMAESASYAVSASYEINYETSSSYADFAVSASYALSASYAKTASYVNPLVQNVIITGSIYIPDSTNSIYFSGSGAASRLVWNNTDGTLDLGLKGGNVTLQIGQETVARVVNKSGGDLLESNFQAVRVRSVAEGGAQGQRLAVVLAQADSDADSATTLGIVTETILDNQEGFITLFGQVRNIDTTGAKSYGGLETWVDGDMLYLSPTYAGYLTNVKPIAPQHLVIMGYVEYAHAINGKIFVKIDNGWELGELHNVLDNSTTSSYGDLLVRSGSVWTNSKQLTGSYGLTGSLNATSFTGSLQGIATSASYVLQAVSASYAATSSYVSGSVVAPGSTTQVVFNNGGLLGADSGFVYSGSNVGIGTSSPAYKLSVAGKLSLVDGVDSVFIGLDAGKNDDGTSNSNIAIGTSASQNNTTGANNIAIGTNTLFSSNASNNTAIGTNALRFNTSGNTNTAIGSFAQVSSSTSTFNVSLGTNTLFNNTIGSFHTALGASVLFSLLTGSSNSGIGSGALFSLITGSENSALGRNAGRYFSTGTSALTEASASIFIGFSSRANAIGETNQIVIGNEALGLGSNTVVLGNDNIVTTVLKGNIGIGKTNPSTKLDVNGNTTITGSLTVTNGITGSLLGTSSYATTALSASYATTASYVLQAVSASFASTASYVNPLRQIVQITGSLNVTGSVYINNALYSNQTNTLATENKVLYSIPTSTYDALFVEYVAKNGTNVRAGQIMSATDGTNAKFTETTTTDLGSTTPLTFNVSIAGGNIQLEASASTSTWTVKTITRTI